MSTDGGEFRRASELWHDDLGPGLDIIHDSKERRTSLFTPECESDEEWLTIDQDWVYDLRRMR